MTAVGAGLVAAADKTLRGTLLLTALNKDGVDALLPGGPSRDSTSRLCLLRAPQRAIKSCGLNSRVAP